MSERFAIKNATCQWGGLTLRGTVKDADLGLKKRTTVVNGNGTTDTHAEPGMSEVNMDLSLVADTEIATIESLVDEPMILSGDGQVYRFPSMTFIEGGKIDDAGTMSVKAQGRRASV